MTHLLRKYSGSEQIIISGWYNKTAEVDFELKGFWTGYATALCCLLDSRHEPEHPDYIPF